MSSPSCSPVAKKSKIEEIQSNNLERVSLVVDQAAEESTNASCRENTSTDTESVSLSETQADESTSTSYEENSSINIENVSFLEAQAGEYCTFEGGNKTVSPIIADNNQIKQIQLYTACKDLKPGVFNYGRFIIAATAYHKAGTFKEFYEEIGTFILADNEELLFRYTIFGNKAIHTINYRAGDLLEIKYFEWVRKEKTEDFKNFIIPNYILNFEAKYVPNQTEFEQFRYSDYTGWRYRLDFTSAFYFSAILRSNADFVARVLKEEVLEEGLKRVILLRTADLREIQITIWQEDFQRYPSVVTGELYRFTGMKRHLTLENQHASFYSTSYGSITWIERTLEYHGVIYLGHLYKKVINERHSFCRFMVLLTLPDKNLSVITDGSSTDSAYFQAFIEGANSISTGLCFTCIFLVRKIGGHNIIIVHMNSLKVIPKFMPMTLNTFKTNNHILI